MMRHALPIPTYSTGLLRALWCRWMHQGARTHTGLPDAGRLLTHHVRCVRCGARYDVQTPNNPRYRGPWDRPDESKPDRWHNPDGTINP